IVYLTDVPQEDRCAIRELDRNVVKVIDGLRHRVGANGVLRVADLGETRRDREVLRIDGVYDVRGSQALGLQFRRIDMDHDLPVFPAIGGRERDARDWSELLA